ARLSLAVTSGVALLAITLACLGRISLFEQGEGARTGVPAVNLNVVVDSGRLEPALGMVFANANDRRLAAQELLRFLGEERNQGRALTHVGAIARANVAAATIDGSKKLDAFSQRLQRSRESAAASGRVAPGAIPLVTAADLATLKPFLCVRTPQEFRRAVLLCMCLYVVAFHLVPLVWWRRDVRGDRLVLAVAHLLTAIGFAALLSRPDPLRD